MPDEVISTENDPINQARVVRFLSHSKGRGRPRPHPKEVVLVGYNGRWWEFVDGRNPPFDEIATEVLSGQDSLEAEREMKRALGL